MCKVGRYMRISGISTNQQEDDTMDTIIIDTKEKLAEYERYMAMDEAGRADSLFYGKDVKLDGRLVAELGECHE